jgi:hypothetical protein
LAKIERLWCRCLEQCFGVRGWSDLPWYHSIS